MDILTGIQICLIAILGDTLLGWLFAFIRGEFDIRQAPRVFVLLYPEPADYRLFVCRRSPTFFALLQVDD